jgi:hypothetical protein
MKDVYVLEFKGHYPLHLMELSQYGCGNMTFKKQGQTVRVSEKERISLLKLRNGSDLVFLDIIEKPKGGNKTKWQSETVDN